MSKKPCIQIVREANGKHDISGSKNEAFSSILAAQVVNSLWTADANYEYKNQKVEAAVAALRGIRPSDEIEGMLATQMIGVHNVAMECLRRAMLKDQSAPGVDSTISRAVKLTNSYARLLDALSKYRGKGQQKVTVEHVHVHPGGQAIVGNITSPPGGGVNNKNEEQPHAKQIDHAPMQEMPSQNKARQKVPVTSND